jgi:16S rRNA processing protein RimM
MAGGSSSAGDRDGSMTSRAKPPAGAEPGAERVLVGRVSAAQGLRGEVRVTSFTEVPENIAAYGPLTDQSGKSVAIDTLRVIKGSVLAVRLAGVADRTAAEKLKGTELYVDKAKLPETDENEWYWDDLVGLRVEAPGGEEIGEVAAVQNYGAGDLLEIRLKDSRDTVFVMFTEQAVPEVDIDGGRVVVVLPEEFDERGE